MLMLAKTALQRRPVGPGVFAGPSFVAAGAKQNSPDIGTINIPYYAGIAANDIAVIWVMVAGSGVSTPSGFTAISGTPTIGGYHIQSYWRRLVGNETGTLPFTIPSGNNGSTGLMFGLRGCITSGTPYEGFAQTSWTASTTTMTSPATTTTGPNRLGVRLFIGNEAGVSTPPAGWTESHEDLSTVGNPKLTIVDTKGILAATTEAASSRTITASFAGAIHASAFIPA